MSVYASIEIGSSQLSMKIYDVTKRYGIQELTHVRHKLSIGAETYTKGIISYPSVNEICTTLNDFKRIMSEFQTAACEVFAASAVREAQNCLMILDQIEVRTGFVPRILSNSEGRFLSYKALALKDKQFESHIEQGTLIVDMGDGSIQLSIYDGGKLCGTQNLLLGASRIQELLQTMENEVYDFRTLIDEYIEKDLAVFHKLYLQSVDIRHVIASGERIPDIYYYLKSEKPDFDGTLAKKALFDTKLPKKIPDTARRLIIPTLILCRKIALLAGCDKIRLSPVDLCDGMAAEYAEKKIRLSASHDFTKDILHSSKIIAGKYMTDTEHIENVQTLALQIFDKIKKLHGLGKRERLLLQIGVILHSCGTYINPIRSRECSYRIIMSTEIIGLSHKERAMIANMVRYDSSHFPAYQKLADDFSQEDYITIVKLNAILRTANVLDKSNRHKIREVDVSLKEGVLTITANTMEDITLEKGLFQKKAVLFEQVFGIRPKLRQKRIGKGGHYEQKK